jgi:hypothetical protein
MFEELVVVCAPAGKRLEDQLNTIAQLTRGNVLIDTRHVEMDKLEGLRIPHGEHIPVVIISKKTGKPQPGFITPETLITAALNGDNHDSCKEQHGFGLM